MSGVLGHRLGRKKSLIGAWVSSLKYWVISHAVWRHAKYVYDCVKPHFASRYMTLGRVNASARKMASGVSRLTSPMSHSQKGKGLVWGLSIRKMRTPLSIQ